MVVYAFEYWNWITLLICQGVLLFWQFGLDFIFHFLELFVSLQGEDCRYYQYKVYALHAVKHVCVLLHLRLVKYSLLILGNAVYRRIIAPSKLSFIYFQWWVSSLSSMSFLCALLGWELTSKFFAHNGQWFFDLFYKVLIERYLWEILSELQVDREIKKSFRVELGIDSFSDTCCSLVFMLWSWQEWDILLYQNAVACIGTYLNSTYKKTSSTGCSTQGRSLQRENSAKIRFSYEFLLKFITSYAIILF